MAVEDIFILLEDSMGRSSDQCVLCSSRGARICDRTIFQVGEADGVIYREASLAEKISITVIIKKRLHKWLI